MKTECTGVGDMAMKNKEEGEGERRGPWTPEEDELLIRYVKTHGEGRWNFLAKSSGLKRTGKSCRLRWLNYLKPDIKRGGLTPEEQLLILDLHSKLGNKWSKIAAHLPGRTDNEIKNYWRTRVQKQAKQLNMDSNSPSFIDAIRCFYMPRLVQKIEQNSTNSTSLNSKGSSSSPSSQNTHFIYSPTMLSSDINKDTSSESTVQQTTTASSANATTVNRTQGMNGSNYDDMYSGSMSATHNSFSECHVAEHGWVWDDVALAGDGMWGLDYFP